MSSVVSHQMLHQLGVIGLYADLIQQDGNADADSALTAARANATAIENALRDVNRVLTDLLVFSKDLRLNLYAHPLPRVLAECADACQGLAAEKQVTLRVDVPAELEIVIDKLKMKQAIDNVLRNAIEMSPAGSEIVLRARVADAHAEISVLDRGPGVPAASRDAIFAPFFTTKEHGTGLGLAIAREFTAAHGGTLVVEERPDGPGAAFVFRLPMRPAMDVAASGA
jgi:signal transduction histidine kinase